MTNSAASLPTRLTKGQAWTLRQRAAAEELARRTRWRDDSAESTYQGFLSSTLPTGWTADAPHIRLIAEHLDAVERGEIDRLAIHMPPRHGKTETVSVRYAAYAIEQTPAENVLLTGYNERFARRLGRKARAIATGRAAQGRIKLAADKQGADEWATAAGGVLMTRGVGSPPTGIGFRRIIVDDPIRKREDAESEVYREKAWDWYTDDLYTRLEPGGAIILVMTLWHEDDIGARAVASEPGRWTVLKLPAIAEECDQVGRVPGEVLWPDRYDLTQLERIRDVMAQNEGLRSWEALYQQNPCPREGSFFKVDRLQIVDAAPSGLRATRAWDQAATPGGGDWTAGVRIEGPDAEGLWYVTDVCRGQWEPDERNRTIRQTAQSDGSSVRIRLTQDPGQAGVDQVQAQTRMLSGFTVKSERATGPKETRADPFASQVNAGNFRLVRGQWNRAFIEELRSFPGGKHDDQVDGAADGYNDLAPARDWDFY